jgi:hypothetical protein
MAMSSAPATERPIRARPVADAPVEALLARSQELARRWAVALILARPLAEMTELPLEQLARTAPALCEALAHALASEEPLERLALAEEAPLAALRALAPEPAALVADVETLRAILWEATVEELRDPPARLLVDTADRLAYVCAASLAMTLRTPREDAPTSAHRASTSSRAPDHVPYRAGREAGERGGVILVDELGVEPRPLASIDDAEERALARPGETPAARTHASDRPSPVDVRASTSLVAEPIEPARTRAAPRARPWDTPLSEEPAMRVRRGPGAPVDEPR